MLIQARAAPGGSQLMHNVMQADGEATLKRLILLLLTVLLPNCNSADGAKSVEQAVYGAQLSQERAQGLVGEPFQTYCLAVIGSEEETFPNHADPVERAVSTLSSEDQRIVPFSECTAEVSITFPHHVIQGPDGREPAMILSIGFIEFLKPDLALVEGDLRDVAGSSWHLYVVRRKRGKWFVEGSRELGFSCN